MKYLITGGLGFIGSKIIEKLSNEGHSIQLLITKTLMISSAKKILMHL